MLVHTEGATPLPSQLRPRKLSTEQAALERAFFRDARAHQRAAAEFLARGDKASSVRESIHAIESAARSLAPSGSLEDALQELEAKAYGHPALKSGFLALCRLTSDEKGGRHPLLDTGTAKADDSDALLIIGVCAAFVSYLISRAQPVV